MRRKANEATVSMLVVVLSYRAQAQLMQSDRYFMHVEM